MRMYFTCLLLICLSGAPKVMALAREDSLNKYDKLDLKEKISASFSYQEGAVVLNNGALLKVPEGFRFLDAGQGSILVQRLWGNPENPGFLGLLLPKQSSPLDKDVLGIEISADSAGHVSEPEARQLNYTALLQEMKQHLDEQNRWRKRNGFCIVTGMDWAIPPYYQPENNTLHLARLLSVDRGEPLLNYEMRILTRKGALCLTAVADAGQLKMIRGLMPALVKKITLPAGQNYRDFNPRTDTFASWSSQMLMVGKILSARYFFRSVLDTWLFVLVSLLIVLFIYTMQYFHRRRDIPKQFFRIDERLN